jgi:hypothetical protein
MKSFEEIKANNRIHVDHEDVDGFHATISMPTWLGSLIVTRGGGWEHISVSPFKKNQMPSYDDLCMLKDMFWDEEEDVIHVFPKKSQYVNNLSNCLHLWRCYYKDMVLPPSCFVGLRKGQTMAECIEEAKEAFALAGEEY